MNKAKAPLGDISVDAFLEQYWQQQPCLIANAYPNFAPLISAEELAGLACEEEVESRIVIQDPQSKDWTLKNGPFSEDAFAKLPNSHWTLLVQAVDLFVPHTADLLEDFNFLPRWRRDDLMISYATKGGGVGAHYDQYDVFLLQASGKRRWQVGGQYNEHSPRNPGSPLLQLSAWQSEQEWVLEPGDVLYIPPGVGHNGVALCDDCMTYSIGFRAPSHAEILCGVTDLASELLTGDQRYRDRALSGRSHPGEISEEAIDQLGAVMAAVATDKALLRQWLGQSVTAPKYPQWQFETQHVDHQFVQHSLKNQRRLQHTAATRMAYSNLDAASVLFVNETQLPLQPAQLSLAQALCAANSLACDDIEPHGDNLDLIKTLINNGALVFSA